MQLSSVRTLATQHGYDEIAFSEALSLVVFNKAEENIRINIWFKTGLVSVSFRNCSETSFLDII